VRLSLLFAAAILFFSTLAMALEEPKYKVLEKEGDFELREYAPMIVAETLVDGDIDDAGSAGFKLIAGYIFGDNTSRQGGSEKIEMTAPVTVEPKSEKISMTVPVTMEKSANRWRMHFVMPSQYTLDTLPIPNNKKVSLREIPARKFAVIRFSGFTGDSKRAKKEKALQEWMQSKNLVPQGEFSLARYNSPWSLPFLRRNEVMVRI
jgi:hypothetical protein